MNDELDFEQIEKPGFAERTLKVVIVSILIPLFSILSVVFALDCVESSIYSREWSYLKFLISGPIQSYCDKNSGQYPSALSWCDELLLIDKDILENEDGSIKKEWGYAVNPEALKLGDKAPEDMVLAFPSVKGWNLSGGPELFRDLPMKRVPILFADFRVKTYRSWVVPYLKWHESDTGKIPVDSINTYLWVSKIIFISWLAWILIFYRRYISLACLAALVPAILGWILDIASHIYLHGFVSSGGLDTGLTGLFAGPVSGLLAGVHFSCYMNRRISKLGAEKVMHPIEFIFPGVFVGILTSMLLHLLLKIAYRDESFLPMIAGLGFGTWAGAFVGWIFYFVFGGKVSEDEASEMEVDKIEQKPSIELKG